MATVWIVNHYAPVPRPGGNAGGRHLYLARALAARGDRVVLLLSAIDHRDGVTQRFIEGDAPYADIAEGSITARALRGRPYSGMGSRLLSMADFERAVLLNTEGLPRPDVVVGSSVHLFAGHAAYLLARRYRVPFVFEFRDVWPKTVWEEGATSRLNPVYIGLRLLEIFLYRRADRILSALPLGKHHVARSLSSASKVAYLPNMVNLAPYRQNPAEEPPDSETFRVTYLGSMTQIYGLEALLEAAAILHRDHPDLPIEIRMVGGGAALPELQRWVEARRLPNLSLVALISREEVPAELARAHALFASFRPIGVVRDFGMSMNKLYEYFGAARPVIFAIDTVENPVERYGAGIVIPPCDAPAIAQAILELYRTPRERRIEMGRKGRVYAERCHSTEVIGRRFGDIIDEVIRREPPGTRAHPDRVDAPAGGGTP